jgi:hypothetical protein
MRYFAGGQSYAIRRSDLSTCAKIKRTSRLIFRVVRNGVCALLKFPGRYLWQNWAAEELPRVMTPLGELCGLIGFAPEIRRRN